MDVLTIELPCTPEFVGVVRTLAKTLFDKVGRGQPARLITSEFVTNSVIHSRSRHGGTVTVEFSIGDSHGRIEVVDAGADTVPIAPGEEDEHRRGLRMVVNAYADKWGQDSSPGRSSYWAELYWN